MRVKRHRSANVPLPPRSRLHTLRESAGNPPSRRKERSSALYSTPETGRRLHPSPSTVAMSLPIDRCAPPKYRAKDLHDVEVASAALDERHVVQKAPVLQHGCAPLRLVRYALDRSLPHVVLALVHGLVPLSYSAERYDEYGHRNADQGGHPQLRGNPSSQILCIVKHGRYACRNKDGQDEVSGNVENVDVPNTVLDGVHQPPEVKEHEHSQGRTVPKEEPDYSRRR